MSFKLLDTRTETYLRGGRWETSGRDKKLGKIWGRLCDLSGSLKLKFGSKAAVPDYIKIVILEPVRTVDVKELLK